MKAAPEAWRLLASVSVDDTGLQRRNLAETGTDSECERDETALPYQTAEDYFGRLCFAHRCLGRRASLSFPASTPQNVLLERCPADNQGSDLRHFARQMHQKTCVYAL
jgi:hypothetical protein